MEGSDDLQRYYEEILSCFMKKEGELAASKWEEIRSRREKNNMDKLFRTAVTCLSSKLRSMLKKSFRGPFRCPHMARASEACEAEVSVIALMVKDADLSAVDDKGKRPIDHVFCQLIGYKSSCSKLRFGCCFPEPEGGMTPKLLRLLMDKSVLDAHCHSGYSYFSMFILMGWWNMVRWSLDCGADVSDNGVCRLLPIDAVFADKFNSYPPRSHIPKDIFARLLHPTTVNRPIVEHCQWLPIHVVCKYMYIYPGYHDLIPLLLDAGAHIDRENSNHQLPMAIYAQSMKIEGDSFLFRQLVPKSTGISPTLFIKLLRSWKLFGLDPAVQQKHNFFKSIFCEHLRLSSGWQEFCVFQWILDAPGKITLQVDNQYLLCACVCVIVGIIDVLSKLGIRARSMSEYLSDSKHGEALRPGNSLHVQKFSELKEKWNDYRSFIPSLRLQCVRVIRSSLGIVTDENVQMLPLPKPIHKVITFKDSMDEMLSGIKSCREQS